MQINSTVSGLEKNVFVRITVELIIKNLIDKNRLLSFFLDRITDFALQRVG